MKQSEKLDRMLRYLYDHRFDGQRYMLKHVVGQLKLDIGWPEAIALAGRLEADNFVDSIKMAGGERLMEITTYGVDYCEAHSYGNAELPLANYSPVFIQQSSNVVVMQGSPGARVNNASPYAELVDTIVKAAEGDQSITPTALSELRQMLDEIKASLAGGTVPRTTTKVLIERFGALSSIGSFVTQLASMILGGSVA